MLEEFWVFFHQLHPQVAGSSQLEVKSHTDDQTEPSDSQPIRSHLCALEEEEHLISLGRGAKQLAIPEPLVSRWHTLPCPTLPVCVRKLIGLMSPWRGKGSVMCSRFLFVTNVCEHLQTVFRWHIQENWKKVACLNMKMNHYFCHRSHAAPERVSRPSRTAGRTGESRHPPQSLCVPGTSHSCPVGRGWSFGHGEYGSSLLRQQPRWSSAHKIMFK